MEILAAVDLTDEAGDVLTAAKKLADGLNASLKVTTVVRPITTGYADLGMIPTGNYAGDFEKEAVQHAATALAKLAAEHQVKPEHCSVLLGSPASEIRRAAEETNTDLIVIGNHGRTGLGIILGSTANSVLHGVCCDVHVVRIQSAD